MEHQWINLWAETWNISELTCGQRHGTYLNEPASNDMEHTLTCEQRHWNIPELTCVINDMEYTWINLWATTWNIPELTCE